MLELQYGKHWQVLIKTMKRENQKFSGALSDEELYLIEDGLMLLRAKWENEFPERMERINKVINKLYSEFWEGGKENMTIFKQFLASLTFVEIKEIKRHAKGLLLALEKSNRKEMLEWKIKPKDKENPFNTSL